jgi:hypothetical protein
MVWIRWRQGLCDQTMRLVGWEIEKESDMVKQKYGRVARQQRDMY